MIKILILLDFSHYMKLL